MSETSSQYVRYINPNANKSAAEFDHLTFVNNCAV